ncbi:MAG: phosphoglycerate kinase [Polyangiaceae bacterium]
MGRLDGILCIDEQTLENQRVLLRLDLDFDPQRERARLLACRSSIDHALRAGARVVLAGHRGSPGGQVNEALSLEPVGAALSELLGTDVYLPDDCVGDAARKVVQDLRPGQVCLLENLDFYAEEAQNDEGFAQKLASFADVYVNDSLRDSSRKRASLDQLARSVRKRCMGLRLKSEVSSISRVSDAAERPLGLVVGGANTAAAFDLNPYPARQGQRRGHRWHARQHALGRAWFETAKVRGRPGSARARPRPLRHRTRSRCGAPRPHQSRRGRNPRAKDGLVASPTSIGDGLMALDVGPKTLAAYAERLATAKAVLWVGPLGASQNPAFAGGTLGLAQRLSEAPAFSVVVGDDAAEAISHADASVLCKFGLVSTAGRAGLELIEGRKLPGIEALRGGAT